MKPAVFLVGVAIALSAAIGATSPASQETPQPLSIIVTSTADSGPGTLREALSQAPAGALITFHRAVFPPDNPATIFILSPLPLLSQGHITIDASDAGVILDGGQLPPEEGVNGLTITSSGNVIRGLQILRFPQHGIGLRSGAQNNTIGGDRVLGEGLTGQGNVISGNGIEGIRIEGSGTDHNLIIGNHIGTDASGTSALGNGFHGVSVIRGAQYNQIGGATAADRNTISGNSWDGVYVTGDGTTHNVISGNYLGTDASGTTSIPNGNFGVNLAPGAEGNVVGGDTSAERNLISGNGVGGVNVAGNGARDNVVRGNFIGVDVSGNYSVPNFHGVAVGDGASYNTVQGNVISGNHDGVNIAGSGTTGNTISGNRIGTSAAGDGAIGNEVDGVWIGDGAQYNVVGGRTPEERNVVSGNENNGVVIDASAHNTISGNFIGTDASGTTPLGNFNIGVVLAWGAQYNLVGGATPEERNLICASGNVGVSIANTNTMSNTVSGNYIGTDVTGTKALGNVEAGVWVGDSAQYNSVGPANVIAHNGTDGIAVQGPETLGNSITANSIHDNEGAGIGCLTGGNAELSPPLITYVGTRIIRGTAPPNSTIEVFSDEGDEARIFEGTASADREGNFTYRVPQGRLSGPNITASATDAQGNTSALSTPQSPPTQVAMRELPGIVGPAQVSLDPKTVGTNLGLALFCVLFFGLTSQVFNTILKDYRDDLLAAGGRMVLRTIPGYLRRLAQSVGGMTQHSRGQLVLTWLAVLLVTSIIESFLDGRVGILGVERVGLLITLFVAGVAVSGLELGSDLYAHRRWAPRIGTESKVQWLGIVVALACVTLSRALDFRPGYLYGIVGAVYVLPKLVHVSQAGKRAGFVLLTVWIGGFILWAATAFLPLAVAGLEPIFLTAFLIALQGVFFALIPMAFTDGGHIWSWRKSVWFVFFSIVLFCFYHFVLNPNASDVQALQQNGVQTLLVLIVVFGIATLLLWMLFPFRLGRAGVRGR